MPARRSRTTPRLLISLLPIFALAAPGAAARQLAGVEFPDGFEGDGVALVLNGAGVRTRFFVDLYAAALYLERKSADAEVILDANEPMAIQLRIVTSLISREAMRESIEDGFRESTRGNTAPFREKIDALIGAFDAEIEDGDRFELVYLPGDGLKVRKNGVPAATIACKVPFKRALFGIWIGDRPVQERLRRELLGRSISHRSARGPLLGFRARPAAADPPKDSSGRRTLPARRRSAR